MGNVTSASLVDALRKIPLLDPAQLEEVARLSTLSPDPKALAGELIRRGWLTPYQANQLLQNRPGDLVLGSHILLERLGEGGMGQVFKARHKNLGRIVALKLIRKERVENPAAIQRFQREIRAVAALSHPHIVRAFDADEIDGTHFLVMEYIEGATDLAHLVKNNGPLPVKQACNYVRQAALGLQHAHERGLVHRDIKPQNLLVSFSREPTASADVTGPTLAVGSRLNGLVKILDMGLARLDEPSPGQDASTTMTQEGVVMGTPDYLAPEQALDAHAADIRADLYSLGCTFYYLLAGQVPFPGGTFMEKINKHSFDEPTPLDELHPGIPISVTDIVSKLMAKKPEDRFQTPGELAQALEAIDNITEDVNETPPTARKDRARADSRMDTAEVRKNTFASALSYMAKRDDTVAFGLPPGKKARRRLAFFLAGGALTMIAAVIVVVVMGPGGNQNAPPNKNDKPIDGKSAVKRHPVDQAWLKQVAAMPTEEKLAAVVAKLKKQNANFDGKVTHTTSDSGLVTELQFFTDDLKDISAVRALEGLQKLDCMGSNWGKGQLHDLSPLEGLQLSSLDCSGTRVADLSPLKGMPLRTLACNGAPVKDLTPLVGMPLTTLGLDGTQVADLEPLKELKLTTLRIAATRVSSLTPLKDMKLTTLACNNTKVTSLAPLKDMPLRELTCDFRPDGDLPILRSIKTLQKINGEPLK